MTRGYNQHQFIVRECLHPQFRRKHRSITFHQAKVQLPVECRLHDFMGVEDGNMQFNLWIASTKTRHNGWQEIYAGHGTGRKCNFSALYIVQRGQRLLHLTLYSEDPPRVSMQDTPGICKGETPPLSFNSLDSPPPLHTLT